MSSFRALIQLCIDGEIDELEQLILQEHLKYCGECREELSQLIFLNRQLQGCRESIIVPTELPRHRARAIEDYFKSISRENRFPLADLARVQYTTWKNVLHSLHHLPGRKTAGSLLRYTRKTFSNRVKKKVSVYRFFPVWGAGG